LDKNTVTNYTEYLTTEFTKVFHREHKEILPQIAKITEKNQPQRSLRFTRRTQRKVATDCTDYKEKSTAKVTKVCANNAKKSLHRFKRKQRLF